jgi:hypothetical protein
VRFSVIGLVMVDAAMAGAWGLARSHRPGSCRKTIRARYSSSCSCPTATDVVRQIEDILNQETAVADYSAITCCRTPAAPVRRRWLRVLRGLLVAPNQDPKLNRVFSTF